MGALTEKEFVLTPKGMALANWQPSEGSDDSKIIEYLKSIPKDKLEKLRRGELTGFFEYRKDGVLKTEEWNDVLPFYNGLLGAITKEFLTNGGMKHSDGWAEFGWVAKYYLHKIEI